MALLFMDGFDHYQTADITRKWNAIVEISSYVYIASGAGRRGGAALRVSNGGYVWKNFAAVSTVIVGFAYNPAALNSSVSTGTDIVDFTDGSIVHVSIHPQSDGSLKVCLGEATTLLGSSAAGVLTVGNYNYIEAKVTIGDTAGAVELRVNGVAVLNLTGIDTRNAGNATVDGVMFGGSAGTNVNMYFDDLYICDTTGTENNDFLGDVRIEPFFPSGAGTHQQFTPSAGTDHAALVDEAAPDGTDYLTGGAAGTKETFTLSPTGTLPASDLIVAVQVNNYCKKSDAGGSAVRNLVRSGTSEATGPTTALSTSYGYVRSIHEINPATGQPWLLGEVQAMEAGLEVVS